MKPWMAKAASATLALTGIGHVLQQRSGMLGAILMLHRVQDDKPSKFNPNGMLSISPAFFEQLCHWLAISEYDVVDMDEALARMSGKKVSANRFVVLTFDDGFEDNVTTALPILERYELPATLFPATGLMEGSANLWWCGLEWVLDAHCEVTVDLGDGEQTYAAGTAHEKCHLFCDLVAHCIATLGEYEQRIFVDDLCRRHGVNLPARTADEMMSVAQLQEFAAHPLMTLGGHTVNHFALGRLAADEARSEIVASADRLEELTGQRPRHFAFPYGHPAAADQREFDMLEELGFASGVTTRRGAIYAGHASRPTGLPRLSVNGHFQSMPFTKTWVTGVPAMIYNKLEQSRAG